MVKNIDARGQACPKPVMMAKAAIDEGARALTISVDNSVSAANVTRFLTKQGWTTEESGQAPEIVLKSRKGEGAEERIREGTLDDQSLLIAKATLGGDDQVLGEALMKAFLGTVAQRERPPKTIALMNKGVLLSLKSHSAHESLEALRDRGTAVLVCGTCANHFGIADAVAVGILSNMFEITEALMAASRQLCLG